MQHDKEELPVLVVDDNPLNRDVLNTFLSSKGYRVEEAVTGLDALERVRIQSYCIILMDLLLPGLDGFETVREMRRMGIRTPIIAQSSLSFKQDRDQSIEAGCNDFIPKPIELRELLRVVKKHTFDSGQLVTKQPYVNGRDLRAEIPGQKILLVEEDDENAERYLQILTGAGADVVRVSNGGDAWRRIEESDWAYGIIVSNMFTSGIDGIGLLAMVKRHSPDLPVIIYASKYEHDSYQLAAKLGADGILPSSQVELSLIPVIESTFHKNGKTSSWVKDAATAFQVRQSQKELNRLGLPDTQCVDSASITLHDAGGDMAFCRELNGAGRHGIILIDVAGHDVVSSYLSAVSLGILTSLWDQIRDPMQFLTAMNTELLKLRSDRYHICVIALLWDQRRGLIHMAIAGNPGGIVVRKAPEGVLRMEVIEGGGMCLGMFPRDDLFVRETVALDEGDYLLLFSDGVDADRLCAVLRNKPSLLNRETVNGLSGELLDQLATGTRPADDMILLSLRQPSLLPETGLHFELEAKYEDVDRACIWVAEQLREYPAPSGHDVDFISLAIREALLNAVEHGSRKRPGARIDLSIYSEPERLRVDVSDEGKGFDLAAKLSSIDTIDPFTIGKRGLPLMRAAADRIETHGGTVSLLFFYKKTIREEK